MYIISILTTSGEEGVYYYFTEEIKLLAQSHIIDR